MKLRVSVSEARESDLTINEGPQSVIVTLQKVQTSKEAYIFSFNAHEGCTIDSENSGIKERVMIWTKADSIPKLIAATRVMDRVMCAPSTIESCREQTEHALPYSVRILRANVELLRSRAVMIRSR